MHHPPGQRFASSATLPSPLGRARCSRHTSPRAARELIASNNFQRVGGHEKRETVDRQYFRFEVN